VDKAFLHSDNIVTVTSSTLVNVRLEQPPRNTVTAVFIAGIKKSRSNGANFNANILPGRGVSIPIHVFFAEV
jgi:hypothetical protein